MRPELARACDARVYLVNNHVDAHLLGHLAQLIGKEACDMMISACRLNWFKHYCSDLNSFYALPMLYLFPNVAERGQILLLIILYVVWVSDRVTISWWLCHRPVKGRNINFSERAYPISISRRRQASQHCPVETILKRQNAIGR